ncbi:hypothetical protein SBV1_1190022 [Verrucomicrobia bacterium]|nr:hypothetical protein SBV1_1190022 [Verrucomicrobiota bacterium]
MKIPNTSYIHSDSLTEQLFGRDLSSELWGWSAAVLLVLVLGAGIARGQSQPQCTNTETVKFFQLPDVDKGLAAWDSGPWVLADDFICTNTGPITDFHVWGSWLNDAVDAAPTFWLGLYDDVPAVTNGPAIIPSHPGTNLLWQQWFLPGQYAQSPWGAGPGPFEDPGPPAPMGFESQVFYYCFSPTNPPVQQGTPSLPKFYWLALYTQSHEGNDQFGWRSSIIQQYDISVFAPWTGTPPINASWQPNRWTNGAPIDLAFVVATGTNRPPPPPCCVETNGVKFVQWPQLANGLDIDASQGLALADDFLCTNTGPVTDIHIWGSWLRDQVDPNAVFTLAIWSDVPAITNSAGVTPSYPGAPLWEQKFGPGEYSSCPYTNVSEQFYNPVPPTSILGPDTEIYYLCFFPTNPFVQQGTSAVPTNYWLSLSAQTTAGTAMYFGWHNSSDYYNDTAVWGTGPFPATWNTLVDPAGLPLSLAFKVNTPTNKSPCPGPLIVCAPDKDEQCGVPWTFDPPTVRDSCCGTNYTLTAMPPVTNGLCPQVITETWVVTDCNGSNATCSQKVTVFNGTPPAITCGETKTNQCGSSWSFDPPQAFSLCCGTNITIIDFQDYVYGTPCQQYYTRVWAAIDCCTNTSFCTQTVVLINTNPILTCAPDKTVECNSSWTFDPPIASSPCCGTNPTVSVVSTTTNGLCPQAITRTWVAIDCCQNRAVCSQTVTVVDTNPPSIDCPTNLVVQTCATNTTVTWTVNASDPCGYPVTVVCTPPSGSTFTNPSTNNVHCVATDPCGNTNTCDFTVTVEAPVLDLSINRNANTITLTWSGGGTLEEASNILGPWTTIPLATSPWTVTISNPQEFYRLVCP